MLLKGAIARRYAGAIFDLARKQNTLDRTLEDIREIAQVFANRKIAYLLREPKIPAKRKEAAIRQALSSKTLPSSLNLALLLVQRELIEAMPNIAAELEQLVRDYRNEAVADVTTATQMDDAEQAAIKRALEQRTHKTIILQSHVNPEILGGVIARIGDTIIDGSVRYRLNALQQHLLTDVSSSHAEFFSPEELAETVKEIGSVDTNHNTQINTYRTTPEAASDNVPADGQEESGDVPQEKTRASRSS